MLQVSVTGESGEVYDVALETIGAGQGSSYGCRDRSGRERVYKQYGVPLTDAEVIGCASRAVLFGREIVLAVERQPGSEEWAAASINWPIDLVLQERALIGVITPLIPAEFLQPDGMPLTFDQLVLERPAAYFRVGVLIRICDLFVVLEERDLAHGGLSEQNVAWNRSQPHAHLIDCDGLRPAQGDGDRLTLAGLIYRGLFLSQAAPKVATGERQLPSGIPAELDPALRALVDRAFSGSIAPHARPSAGEWLAGLKAAFLTPDGGAYRPDALALIDLPAPQGDQEATVVAAISPAEETVENAVPETAVPRTPPAWHTDHVGAPATPLLTTPFSDGRPAHPPASGSKVAGILAAITACIGVIALIGFAAFKTNDPNDSTDAYTTYSNPYSTSSYSYTPPTTTPVFDWGTLNSAVTDKTPFSSDALLPESFRDSKNVEYTMRAAGVNDCITPDMSRNVKSVLNSYNCEHMIAGSYIDRDEHILVSIDVVALPAVADADNLYSAIKGQNQDWAIWCPKSGTGSSVCDGNSGYATRSGWSSHQYRYVYESTALYINLTQDKSITDWLDAAASAAVKQAGPENYWHK
ncbi:MAG: hypothetical protein JWN03_4135 [Nocardia sp.]|uniref:hypothetical protein n=1 Tax=Nocardia sp. TaxID=1821 RepID=UPI00262427EF|nr:hypothetical protein [Nocardia sp.]MCU1643860.1 hypothetical protein [Nocardia sp.]